MTKPKEGLIEKASKLREPTAIEADQIVRARAELHRKRKERISPPAYTLSDADGDVSLSNPHSDGAGWNAAVQTLFGTDSGAFSTMLTSQVTSTAGVKGDKDIATAMSQGFAFMAGVQPGNEVEAALGAQMWAIHMATMKLGERLRTTDELDRHNAFGGLMVKMARTFAAQAEALAKLRSGGKQQVEVRYVYVDARGGQNVIAGGGVQLGKGTQPHEPAALAHLAAAGLPPLWSQEPDGAALSGAGADGPKAMPVARGVEPGRAPRPRKRRVGQRPSHQ